MNIFRKKYCKCPIRLQQNDKESAVVALQMVLAYHGAFLSSLTLRDRCFVERDGIDCSGLSKVAKEFGLEGKCFENINSSDLLKLKIPAIVELKDNKFAVFTGKKGENWYFNDTATGLIHYSEQYLTENFTGNALELLPDKKFIKVGEEKSAINNILDFAKSDKSGILALVITSFLLIPFIIIEPNLSKIYLDNVLNDEKTNWAIPIILFSIILLFINSSISTILYWLLAGLNLRLSSKKSIEFFVKLFSFPAKFTNIINIGDLVNRFQDNNTVVDSITEKMITKSVDFLYLSIFSCLIIYIEPFLGSIAVFIIFSLLVMGFLYRHRIKDFAQINKKIRDDISCFTISGISMLETLRATSFIPDMMWAMENKLNYDYNLRYAFALRQQQINSIRTGMEYLVKYIFILLSVLKVLSGQMSGGAFVVFQFLLSGLFGPINGLTSFTVSISDSDVKINSIKEVIEYNSGELSENKNIVPENNLSGKIEFDNVSFGYNKLKKPLINNFNLTIEPGERIAIVGKSGSGKSSVLKLLSGINKPWNGRILFDGINRDDFSPDYLKYYIAFVDQDIVFFNCGDLYENLTMFDRSIEFQNVEKAAKDALIYDTIIAQKGGFHCSFAENNSGFSGGEKQRLEITRALALNPSIIVLDEATSALDTITETQINENIKKRNITTIIVAHRLSTIRDADKIIVLDNGEIVEAGSHEELMKQNGVYRSLIDSGEAD